jgi:pSer/pThr/pTyr-binding forkhead associated (FHA) protein
MEHILEVVKGLDAGSRFKITGPRVLFGRDKDSDIVIDDKSVSRKHAELIYLEGGYLLKDLDSAQGVVVNGRKVKDHFLKSGDIFIIGSSSYRYINFSQVDSPIRDKTIPGIKLSDLNKVPIPMAMKGKTNKKRLIIYGGLGAFLLIFILLLSGGDKEKEETEEQKTESSVTKEEFDIEDMDIDYKLEIEEGMEEFFKKANEYYFTGRREFLLKNYTRALEEFRKALTFYPRHANARYYAKVTEQRLKEQGEELLNVGKKLFYQFKYDLASRNFQEVMDINKRDTDSKIFKEADAWKKRSDEMQRKVVSQ